MILLKEGKARWVIQSASRMPRRKGLPPILHAEQWQKERETEMRPSWE
jgi:hypothetical protein